MKFMKEKKKIRMKDIEPSWIKTEQTIFEQKFFQNPNRFWALVGSTAHDIERHANQSLVDCLDRCLTEEKSHVSRFTNKNQLLELWEDTILNDSKEIVKWAMGGSNKKLLILPTENTSEQDPGEEPIGDGIAKKNGKFVHVITCEVRLILRKSYNPYNEFGFESVTMYPNLLSPTAIETGKDLRPIMKQTKAYQKASETEQKRLLSLVRPLLTDEDLEGLEDATLCTQK